MDQRVGGSDSGSARYWLLQADAIVHVLGKERGEKQNVWALKSVELCIREEQNQIWHHKRR